MNFEKQQSRFKRENIRNNIKRPPVPVKSSQTRMDHDENSNGTHGGHRRNKSRDIERYSQDCDKEKHFKKMSRRNAWQESKSKQEHINTKEMCYRQNMHYNNHERHELNDLQAKENVQTTDQKDQKFSKTLHRIQMGMKIIKTEDNVDHIEDMLVAFKNNETNMTSSEAMQLCFAKIELTTELYELKEKLANIRDI